MDLGMKTEMDVSVRVLLCLILSQLVAGTAQAFDWCGVVRYSPGQTTVNYMVVNSRLRSYGLYVPADHQRGSALVFDFHGFANGRVQEQKLSCWDSKAAQEGFAVVYPQGAGLIPSWNSGEVCCEPRRFSDEAFALKLASCLLDEKRSHLDLDTGRVYATGLSNGGAMAGFLACNHSDVFSAALVVSQSFPYRDSSVCRQQRGTATLKPGFSVLEMRGKWDPIVPYSFSWGVSLTADRSLRSWADTNQCDTNPRVEDICDRPGAALDCQYGRSSCETYYDCDNQARVSQCALNHGHLLYGNAQGFDICSEAWSEFERFSVTRRQTLADHSGSQ
ncbi:hypothetical protein FT643_21615 [Ketobacter sp. MCCC 1A13808]|nr:hypothetical protein [Ketobacter sp. MCCC 1A13808]RLP55930.1 MAG: hypothetical protein D6160_00525 [Ketobacter sp.]